ncbi:MAG: DUF6159 family protein [Acidobacteriota bacterium]
MASRLSNTWSLMGASWNVLKKDKELLVFPLLSGICCLLVLASFAMPVYNSGWSFFNKDGMTKLGTGQYVLLFLFYFVNYFIITFFNSAVVACAIKRMKGGDPTVSDGFQAAFQNIHLILGWAVVAAIVGAILRAIEERSGIVGRIVTAILGMAWSIVSFLVIPIMVAEGKGPLAALKDSTALLKKTWGEQLIGNFAFGLIIFFFMLPVIPLIFIGFFLTGGEGLVLILAIAALYVILLSLVQSVLQSIFQSAVYLYAREGEVAEGFDSSALQIAIRPR